MRQIANSSALRKTAITVALLWVAAQIIIVCIYGCYDNSGPNTAGYIRHALQAVREGTTYPTMTNINDWYIQSPGWVNLLALVHWLTGTADFLVMRFVNILLNVAILYGVYRIARRFFSQTAAYWTVILWCVILTNIFAPIALLTELPFEALAVGGLCLTFRNQYWSIAVGSLMFGYAYTIRPVVLVFVVVGIVWLVIERRQVMLRIAAACVPFAAVLLLMGMHNEAKTGAFVTTSTTGGYNLIMTGNDKGGPAPDFSLFNDTANLAYIPDVFHTRFDVKDSIWKARAKEWIRNHPV